MKKWFGILLLFYVLMLCGGCQSESHAPSDNSSVSSSAPAPSSDISSETVPVSAPSSSSSEPESEDSAPDEKRSYKAIDTTREKISTSENATEKTDIAKNATVKELNGMSFEKFLYYISYDGDRDYVSWWEETYDGSPGQVYVNYTREDEDGLYLEWLKMRFTIQDKKVKKVEMAAYRNGEEVDREEALAAYVVRAEKVRERLGETPVSGSQGGTGGGTVQRINCIRCNGTGQQRCIRCNGKGSIETLNKAPNFGQDRPTSIWQTCYACGGSGTTRCASCGGFGYILH